MIKPTPMPNKPAPISKKPTPMPKKPGTPIMLPKDGPRSGSTPKPAPMPNKPFPMPKKPRTPIMLPKTAPTSKQDSMMDMAKKKFVEKPMGMAKGGMTKAKGMAKKGKK